MSPEAYIEMAEVEASHWWFVGRRAILARILSQLDLPSNAKVLEIGVGTGGNLPMLARFGQVSGLEMDETARQIAVHKTGGRFDIRAGQCPADIPFEGQKFDLICLFDVLEHIEDDQETLAVLTRLLTDGGKAVITVPAYEWLWSTHDEFLHHKRRYRAPQLRQCFDEAGLTVVRMSYFNTLLFPLAVLARFKDKLTGAKHATGSGIPSRPLNDLLTSVFSAERCLLSWLKFPFGVSLLAVIRKGDGHSK